MGNPGKPGDYYSWIVCIVFDSNCVFLRIFSSKIAFFNVFWIIVITDEACIIICVGDFKHWNILGEFKLLFKNVLGKTSFGSICD